MMKNQLIKIIIEKTAGLPTIFKFSEREIKIEVKKKGMIKENNNPRVSNTGRNQCLRAIKTIYSFCSNLNAISKYI